MQDTIDFADYSPLCWKISTQFFKRFRRSGLDVREFYSESYFIFLRARENYRPGSGKFSTYLYKCLKTGLLKLFRQGFQEIPETIAVEDRHYGLEYQAFTATYQNQLSPNASKVMAFVLQREEPISADSARQQFAGVLSAKVPTKDRFYRLWNECKTFYRKEIHNFQEI